MRTSIIAAAITGAIALGGAAWAQGTGVAFGGLKHDPSLPVEVAAEQLQVDQSDGSATFTGEVLITQGSLRLSAGEVRVIYAQGGAGSGEIDEMRATGGVTLTNGGESAEAQEAVYSIESGTVTMNGDVILTQGGTALSSNRLVIDLNSGTGTMEGRVRTVFQPSNN